MNKMDKLRQEYRDKVGSTFNMKYEWYTDWLENELLKTREQLNKLNLEVLTSSLPRLEKGDKIKLYGNVTTVTGFEVYWNDALEPPRYEIILLTTGRCDPFERSLDVIEVLRQ